MILQIVLGLLAPRSRSAADNSHSFFKPASLSALIGRYAQQRRTARQWQELLQLNDYLLRDIGLQRDALFQDFQKWSSPDERYVFSEQGRNLDAADPKRFRAADARSP